MNLHFLNYSKSCQVRIHNRKLTNSAVVLKTHLIFRKRNTDGMKLVLKLLPGGKGSRLDHPLPVLQAESGWVAGTVPFGGR